MAVGCGGDGGGAIGGAVSTTGVSFGGDASPAAAVSGTAGGSTSGVDGVAVDGEMRDRHASTRKAFRSLGNAADPPEVHSPDCLLVPPTGRCEPRG